MSGETLYVDPEQLALAFARLQVGHGLIYAHGPVLDPGNATVRLVNGWAAEGRASLHNAGRDGEGRLMRRLVKKPAGQQAQAAGSARGSDNLTGLRVKLEAAGLSPRALRDCVALGRALTVLARNGQVCPSNAELAEGLILPGGADRVKYLMKLLMAAQVVAVVCRPPHPRVVQIVGTRLHTADPAGVLDRFQRADGLQAQIERAFG